MPAVRPFAVETSLTLLHFFSRHVTPHSGHRSYDDPTPSRQTKQRQRNKSKPFPFFALDCVLLDLTNTRCFRARRSVRSGRLAVVFTLPKQAQQELALLVGRLMVVVGGFDGVPLGRFEDLVEGGLAVPHRLENDE